MHKTLDHRRGAEARSFNELPGASLKHGIKRIVNNFKDSATPRLSGEFAHS
jgi:hypothetical protein